MPHDPELSRYRLYRLDRLGELHLLSETSKEGIGTALVQHTEDGDIGPNDRIGILDRPFGNRGTWLVSPYAY
jgi:hypothetical protein